MATLHIFDNMSKKRGRNGSTLKRNSPKKRTKPVFRTSFWGEKQEERFVPSKFFGEWTLMDLEHQKAGKSGVYEVFDQDERRCALLKIAECTKNKNDDVEYEIETLEILSKRSMIPKILEKGSCENVHWILCETFSKFCNRLNSEKPFKQLKEGWTVTKYLASGFTSDVFCVRDKEGRKGVMKLIIDRGYGYDFNDPKKEVKLHKLFQKHSLAPAFHSFSSRYVTRDEEKITVFAMIMEEVSRSVFQYLQTTRTKAQIQKLCDKIHSLIHLVGEKGLVHGDFHSGNIGMQGRKLILLDFGLSREEPGGSAEEELDCFLNNIKSEKTAIPSINKQFLLKCMPQQKMF